MDDTASLQRRLVSQRLKAFREWSCTPVRLLLMSNGSIWSSVRSTWSLEVESVIIVVGFVGEWCKADSRGGEVSWLTLDNGSCEISILQIYRGCWYNTWNHLCPDAVVWERNFIVSFWRCTGSEIAPTGPYWPQDACKKKTCKTGFAPN